MDSVIILFAFDRSLNAATFLLCHKPKFIWIYLQGGQRLHDNLTFLFVFIFLFNFSVEKSTSHEVSSSSNSNGDSVKFWRFNELTA